MNKLALSIICKDEYKELDNVLKTVAQFVDGVFITHTSKDNEKEVREVCDKYKATYSYFEWVEDFSKARNFAMSQIPKEFTHMMWLDCDDIVLGGSFIRSDFDEMVRTGKSSIVVEYIYMSSPEGVEHLLSTGSIDRSQVMQTLTRERIIALDGSFEWAGRLHETLVPKTQTMGVMSTDKWKVFHLADVRKLTKSSERNLRILSKAREEEVKAGEIDPRTTFLLARSYFDKHDKDGYQMAEDLFKEHIANSGWDEEICVSWNYLADIYRNRGNLADAMKASFEALKIDPRFPEVYAGIALNFLLSGRYERAYFWSLKGISMPEPHTTIVRHPRATTSNLLISMSESALKLNNLDESWAAATKLNELNPGQPDLQSRLMFVNDIIQEREITKKYVDLSQYLNGIGQKDKLESLVRSIPSSYGGNPILSQIRKNFTKPHKWEEGSVAIYCGPGFELWSPDSLKKGIGGSEEAIIYLAWEMAKRGRRVVVYGDPPEERTYDNVEYKVHYEFNHEDEFDTLIIWRRPALLDTPFKAKRILLDLHDVPNAVDFTPERLARVTKIMLKSQYHREFIPSVPDDKIVIISNGINVHHLEQVTPEWRPGRLFYGSSYDRGLEGLLKIWPDIRKEFPEARLNVFYGWQLFDTAYRNNPQKMSWKAEMEKMLLQDGIIHHGRVGQRELANTMGKCSIFAYPCSFEEINCLTAIRSQALGLIPVVTDYAALKETVKFGEKSVGEVRSPLPKETLENYKGTLLGVLRNEAKYDRDAMIKWARSTFSWEEIAKQWEGVLK